MNYFNSDLKNAPNFPQPYDLRLYQRDLIEDVLRAWMNVKRVLVQLPTGGGKSAIIGFLIREIVRRGEPILVVAHKIELIRQLCQHIEDWTGLTPGIIANKRYYKPNPDALIQIASIQALTYKKSHQLPKASLVVIDETHHAASRSYTRLFEHYGDAYFLGATATPMRLDGRGLRYLYKGVPGFEELVTGPPLRELIEEGWISDFKLFTGNNLLDPRAAGIKVRNGDYITSQLEEYANKILLTGEIVATWERHALGKRTVLYPVSVKLSLEYCEEFNAQGIPAAHIDAETPALERERILEKFRLGEILVLCQHSIVIEGVDIPDIECVQFARPTKSLTIWFQAIGRALRRAPNKDCAIIIDHSTTHRELPWVDDPITWSLDPISLPKNTFHALQCPQCNHVFRPNSEELEQAWAACPVCQTKFSFLVNIGGFGQPAKVVEILPAEFSQLERELNPRVMGEIDSLFERKERNNYKMGWVGFKALEIEDIGYFELLELAKRLGYKPGWAWHKWQAIIKISMDNCS